MLAPFIGTLNMAGIVAYQEFSAHQRGESVPASKLIGGVAAQAAADPRALWGGLVGLTAGSILGKHAVSSTLATGIFGFSCGAAAFLAPHVRTALVKRGYSVPELPF
jgi:hypothetical protein